MLPSQPVEIEHGGIRLSVAVLKEGRLPLVLVHGLAGHGGEWEAMVAYLPSEFYAVAPDGRGHGSSERRPADLSREAHIGDLVAVTDHFFGTEPVILIGQSLGGNTAMLMAAHHPERVRALVVIEASPRAAPEATGRISNWLARWPRPFASREAATEFFGDGEPALAWVAGLEERQDGLWPRFDDDVLLACLDAAARQDWWSDWARITAPTLVVRGASGWLTDVDVAAMTSRAA